MTEVKNLRLKDLSRDQLNRIDFICDLLLDLQDELLEGYISFNRLDILLLIEGSRYEDDYDQETYLCDSPAVS